MSESKLEPKKLSQQIPSEELINLLPHKGKMFLLDHIIQHDTKLRTLESISNITKEHIFYDTALDGIPSYVAFELIAQSISALSGITGAELGRPAQPGFILSIVNYAANVPCFKVGTSVHVVLKKIDEMDHIMTYSGEAFSSENPNEAAVLTTITVMETDDLRVLDK